jgi:membrane protein required for colicin V production
VSDLGSIDIAILIVVLFCGLLGVYWGVIRQVLALAGLLAGLAHATAHYLEVADQLSSLVDNQALARVIAFVLIMVSVSSATSLAASFLRKFVGLLFLGWLDHALGGLLGALQGALICTTVLLVLSIVPAAPWSGAIEASSAAPWLIQTLGGVVLALLPASFQVASRTMFGAP